MSGPDRVARTGIAVALVSVLVPYLYELGRLIVTANQRIVFVGDVALEELATRDAWHGHQLVGPYSRFGWHHPGPALFYAFALPVRLFGPNGPGLLVGALLINAISALAIVLLVWRRAGWKAALWASGTLTILRLLLGAWLLRDAWNPYVIVMPMVLFVVLVADAGTGSIGSWAWALVVGSFEVQTHISSGPVVAALFIGATLALAVHWWREPSARHLSTATAGAAAGGVLVTIGMWVPPLIDAVEHHPSNLHQIWSFFTSPHPTHGISQSTQAALASATVFPFGLPRSIVQVPTRSGAGLAAGGVGFLVVLVVAVVFGCRRRQPLAVSLAALSLLGLVVAMVGNTRAVGTLAAYLTLWQVFVPVTLLLALGVVAFGGESRGRSGAPPTTAALLTVAVLAATGVAVSQVVRLPAPAHDRGHASSPLPGLAQSFRVVEASLAPADRVVRITINSHEAWPVAAGLTLDLERNGRHTTVTGTTGNWTVLFGDNRRSTGREDVDLELYDSAPGEVQGAPPKGSPIERWGTLTFFLNRLR